MLKVKKILPPIILSVLLSSCGTTTSHVKSGNEFLVTVGHVGYGLTPQLTSEARQVAEEYCNQFGKTSKYTGIVRDSGVGPEEFDFSCLPITSTAKTTESEEIYNNDEVTTSNSASTAKTTESVEIYNNDEVTTSNSAWTAKTTESVEIYNNDEVTTSNSASSFPNQPIDVQFTAVPKRQDDIAVIIGNANYEKMGKDIPNVSPAYADAEGIKRYFLQAKGVKEGNIIYLKDATGSQLASVFGNQNTHKGQLYNWVKKTSNVYIYYAGHGVPGGDKGNAYLVPTDANAQTIDLSGYPLETLYSNLGKLPVKSITVILEACFSGASQAGNLFYKSSPIVIRATKTMIPENVKVISAGAVDQMASWELDNSHGLFTKYFLKAMSGEGDKNNDGEVSDTELKNYLDETMTYYARRYYGRDQTVQIMQGN